jgi:hypothetical protein
LLPFDQKSFKRASILAKRRGKSTGRPVRTLQNSDFGILCRSLFGRFFSLNKKTGGIMSSKLKSYVMYALCVLGTCVYAGEEPRLQFMKRSDVRGLMRDVIDYEFDPVKSEESRISDLIGSIGILSRMAGCHGSDSYLFTDGCACPKHAEPTVWNSIFTGDSEKAVSVPSIIALLEYRIEILSAESGVNEETIRFYRDLIQGLETV